MSTFSRVVASLICLTLAASTLAADINTEFKSWVPQSEQSQQEKAKIQRYPTLTQDEQTITIVIDKLIGLGLRDFNQLFTSFCENHKPPFKQQVKLDIRWQTLADDWIKSNPPVLAALAGRGELSSATLEHQPGFISWAAILPDGEPLDEAGEQQVRDEVRKAVAALLLSIQPKDTLQPKPLVQYRHVTPLLLVKKWATYPGKQPLADRLDPNTTAADITEAGGKLNWTFKAVRAAPENAALQQDAQAAVDAFLANVIAPIVYQKPLPGVTIAINSPDPIPPKTPVTPPVAPGHDTPPALPPPNPTAGAGATEPQSVCCVEYLRRRCCRRYAAAYCCIPALPSCCAEAAPTVCAAVATLASPSALVPGLATAAVAEWAVPNTPATIAARPTFIQPANLGAAGAVQSTSLLLAPSTVGSIDGGLAGQLFDRGFAAYWSGDVATAENFCRQAIQLNDRDPRAWYYLGLSLASQGRGDESASSLGTAAQLHATLSDQSSKAVSRALERLQGTLRQQLQTALINARLLRTKALGSATLARAGS